MDLGMNKHMSIQLGMITIVAVLIGGFSVPSIYGEANTNTVSFKSDFEFISVPSCGVESVTFSGTAHFVFHETTLPDGTTRASATLNYMKTGGFGESGDKYELNEVRHSTFNDNSNTDVIHSVITGKLVHNGKQTDTRVIINLLTVFGSDGEVRSSVEKIEFRCNGPET